MVPEDDQEQEKPNSGEFNPTADENRLNDVVFERTDDANITEFGGIDDSATRADSAAVGEHEDVVVEKPEQLEDGSGDVSRAKAVEDADVEMVRSEPDLAEVHEAVKDADVAVVRSQPDLTVVHDAVEDGDVAMVQSEVHEAEEEVKTLEYQKSFLLEPNSAVEDESGTEEEQAEFMKELETFHKERYLEFKPPRFYGEPLNCLKLWRSVIRNGGYEQVTAGKVWRYVGESFNPPKTCTTVSWTFRCFYEKALLEYEKYKMSIGDLPFSDTSYSEPASSTKQ